MSAISLTNADEFQSGFAFYTTPVSTSAGLTITFDFFSYGGTGGDGISFFLIDGAESPTTPGGFGGSLGYAPNTAGDAAAGLVGGYLGIGFDEFGNFSNPTEGRVGGPGVISNSIAVRGSERIDYAYLIGTSSLPLPLSNSAVGATRETSRRSAQISVSPSGSLEVSVDLNEDGDFDDAGEAAIQGFDFLTAGNGNLPDSFKFGFAAASGVATNIHEVDSFVVTTFGGTPLSGSFTADLTLIGADDSDNLLGGDGNDSIDSGSGNDSIDSGSGNDSIGAGDGDDIIDAGDGDDIIIGGAGNDVINSGEGNDVLNGGLGNDILTGLQGNDVLNGGEGNDTIDGGEGDDLINGGEGKNTLTGGDGADLFVYSASTQKQALRLSTFKKNARDKIVDFDGSEGDRILMDFDGDLSTGNPPKQAFYLGKIKAKSLKKAIKEVFSDRLPGKQRDQPLKKNQAFLFSFKRTLFLGINDRKSSFSPKNDFLIEIGKGSLNEDVGKIASSDYFARNADGFGL